MTDLNTLKLPLPGKYTRLAIDHPDVQPGYGKRSTPVEAPRTNDPSAIETLIIETVALNGDGRDIIGKIKYVGKDEFEDYSTSLAIFSKAGWTHVQGSG